MSRPTIFAVARKQWGQTVFYPGCHISRALAKLTGTQTLTRKHFECARALGYDYSVREEVPAEKWLAELMGDSPKA